MSVCGQVLHSCGANGVANVYSAVKMKSDSEDGCGPSNGAGTGKLYTLAVTITTTTRGRCVTKKKRKYRSQIRAVAPQRRGSGLET